MAMTQAVPPSAKKGPGGSGATGRSSLAVEAEAEDDLPDGSHFDAIGVVTGEVMPDDEVLVDATRLELAERKDAVPSVVIEDSCFTSLSRQ